MIRFIFLMLVAMSAMGLSGCCGPTQFFRCGACIYDTCVVPTAKSPDFNQEISPQHESPIQAAGGLQMSY